MEIFFDPVKSFKNDLQRQLPFERVVDFEWGTAVYSDDKRFAYPEKRVLVMGFLGERVHMYYVLRKFKMA
ncbi:MAG TPA: hypothetical protein VJK30_07240 [Coxiellaceae bacterium]|nr:hypothetical protein [Coxiellaceae bacterium]